MSVNRSTLAGRIATDISTRQAGSSDLTVTEFNLAVDRRVAAGKEKKTDFIPIQVWNGIGKAIAQHKAKGDFLVVSGSLHRDQWEKDGTRHERTYLKADDIDFGPKVNGGSSSTPAPAGSDPQGSDDDIPF